MAGKICEAGIRFNDEQLKYAKMVFNGETMKCTMHIDIIINGVLTKMTAVILPTQWVPLKDVNDSALQATRVTKSTAKKTVKESK